jgi:hypothetical protein
MSWEHPCDSYYKQLYQKERLKKSQRNTQQQYINPKNRVIHFQQFEQMDLGSLQKFDKKQDPILKLENEKKLNSFIQKKEEEY